MVSKQPEMIWYYICLADVIIVIQSLELQGQVVVNSEVTVISADDRLWNIVLANWYNYILLRLRGWNISWAEQRVEMAKVTAITVES